MDDVKTPTEQLSGPQPNRRYRFSNPMPENPDAGQYLQWLLREVTYKHNLGCPRDLAVAYVVEENSLPQNQADELRAAFDRHLPEGFSPKAWHFNASWCGYKVLVHDGQAFLFPRNPANQEHHFTDGKQYIGSPVINPKREREMLDEFEHFNPEIVIYLSA